MSEVRHSTGLKIYDREGKGKCWIQWHPDLKSGPYCHEKEGHTGQHKGFGLSWEYSPQVTAKTARKFLDCYRAVPNSYHDITLNNDGTVSMTLNAFHSSVMFINASGFDD